MIIDTHAHYDDKQFDIDRDQLLKSLFSNGMERIVNIGASIETSKSTIELTKQYEQIYGAIGVHPNEVEELNEEKMAWLKTSCSLEKIVAVGEIGLDYYYKEPERSIQKEWFDRQMNLAREVSLPMVIHSRDAAADTLDMMKAANARDIGGVIHCFSYAKEMAREFLNMGFYLGIGGVVTFKNGKTLKEVVEYAPIEQLVLETDCPYLSPEPNRGTRNDSGNLKYVINQIADLKKMTYEEVVMRTNENAKRLYRF
ncbi:MAG: TatD family hydrolase [bacterium]|nr:TatD family hydrolase [bacterium]